MSSPMRVLAVDDQPDTSQWMRILLENRGYQVQTAATGEEAERLCDTWSPDLVLLDMVLPDVDGLVLLQSVKEASPEVQVIMVTGHGSVSKAVEAMSLGAFSFIEKPVEPDHLVAVLAKASEQARLVKENRQLRDELESQRPFPNIIARSEQMQQLFKLMRLVAPTDASILIHGENGTGKELVAAALHENSKRADKPFIRLNCAAIPSELLESELFGHRRGSFTGAVADKVGLVELADGGSLLLDEIAEMSTALQAKLLRVLQDREFRPVGSTRTVRPNFRLICATNVDLQAALGSGKLRQDLYFRINTVTLAIPALRERPEDIPLLAEHFRAQFAATHARDVRGIDPEARRLLLRYAWPGNVRELEHVIERAVIVGQGTQVTPDDLPDTIHEQKATESSGFVIPPHHTLAEIEKMAIVQTLERTRWNKRAAASALGVYRPTLYNKLRKYHIWEPRPRNSGPEVGEAESAVDAEATAPIEEPETEQTTTL